MQKTYHEWRLFLDRPPLAFDLAAVGPAITGKRILITGAGGCIGSALAASCSQLPIASLALLDISEQGIYGIDSDLGERGRAIHPVCIVGDICDEALVRELFHRHRPHIVFHAAACKHVPLMEKNPFTVARTNILGTQVIAEAAAFHKVEHLVLLSTDKAVAPASIMGATKRIAELITLANASSTQMKTVRLGNVLDSSGSVVPLFRKQIAAGKPLSVTHPDATRYFLTLDEAVSLLLSALLTKAAAAVLVAEPGTPHRIHDLATFFIAQQSPAAKLPVRFTQLRPGDKLHEEMLSPGESFLQHEGNSLRSIRTPSLTPHQLGQALNQITRAIQSRDLHGLLEAFQDAVPDYRPSASLQAELPLQTEAQR